MQSISALFGLAKQTAKGTIATNPTFSHGLIGGTPLTVDPSQAALDATAAKRAQYNVYRDGVKNSAGPNAFAYKGSLGLYLLGALGADTVTGTSPYVHTYSTGDLPYLTAFLKGLDSTIEAVKDCKVDELSIKWDGRKLLEINAKMMGTNFSYPATFVPTTAEEGTESFMIPVGGTFQLDPIGASLASFAIVGGEITIKNNLELIEPSASIEATDVTEGVQEMELKLSIVVDDLALFRKYVTGSGAGTAATAAVPYGSVSLGFKENQAGAATLAVTGSKIAFATSLPDAQPKGGPVQLELAGIPVMPAGGTAPLVFALSNTTTSY